MLSILVTKKTKMSHRQLKVSQLQKGRSPKQHSYPSQCIRNTVSEECALSKKRSRLWPWQKRSSLGFSNLIGRTTGQRTENWSSVSCEGVKYRLLPPSDAHRVYACDQQTSLRSKKVFFSCLGTEDIWRLGSLVKVTTILHTLPEQQQQSKLLPCRL